MGTRNDSRHPQGIERAPLVPLPHGSDPVVQDEEGYWHFWDEDWSRAFGPYPTEEAAREALREYTKLL